MEQSIALAESERYGAQLELENERSAFSALAAASLAVTKEDADR